MQTAGEGAGSVGASDTAAAIGPWSQDFFELVWDRLGAASVPEWARRLGVPRTRLYSWLRGEGWPRPARVADLAQRLGVEPRRVFDALVVTYYRTHGLDALEGDVHHA